MASGSIISQARTSEAYLPVENVTVAYFAPTRDGQLHLLAVRRSDASGKTAPVVLDTPDGIDSQQPQVGAPYRTVNLIADHPGYERITVRGVQVFDGIVTNQDLMLVPLPSPVVGVAPQEFFEIVPQDL